MSSDDSLKKSSEIDLPLSTDWKPSFKKEAESVEDGQSVSEEKAVSVKPDKSEDTEQIVEKKKEPVEPIQETPTKACPKCGYVNKNFFSCDACGLIFSKWQYAARDKKQSILKDVREEALALWQDWLDDTTDAESLEKFHSFCVDKDVVKLASEKYREWLLKDPKNKLLLDHQQKIINRAMGSFVMVPTPKAKKKEVSAKTFTIAFLIMVVISALLANFLVHYFE